MFAVVISEKGGAERREVFEGSEVSVGRVRGNDLVLSKGNVSKRHARLTQKDGRFVVVDQNSTNGTYVNRQRIMQATIVREGDRIYIGDFILRIEGAGSADLGSSQGASRAENETIERNSWAGPSADELKSPRVPPAPRVPAPVSRVPRRAPEPSEHEITRGPRTEATLRQDPMPVESVRILVDRVVEKVERRTLEREVTDAVARRVERALLDELGRLRDDGGISPQMTEEQLLVAARAELVGLGPLESLLRNPHASQLTANGTKSVSVVQDDRVSFSHVPFSSPESLERALARLCRMSEATHDGRETFMSGRLHGGISWQAARQRAAPEGIVLMMRRRMAVQCSLEDLVREGAISRAMATFFAHCVQVRANLLVTGPRLSSVARVLSALAEAVADRQLLLLEDSSQLASGSPTAIRLDPTAAAADPARLVDFVSSVSEGCVVIENLSGNALVAALDLMGRGDGGVFGGACSSGVEQGLSRLSTSFASMTPGASVQTARQALFSCFDLALEVCTNSDGRDRVRRVTELGTGREGATELSEIYSFVAERTAAGGAVEGTFLASGTEPRLVEELRARGIAVDGSLFHRSAAS